MRKERKRIVFDQFFTADIKRICLNDTPAGSVPENFSVSDGPEYGVLMYDYEKEIQAMDILFIAIGRAWLAAKEKGIVEENR